VKQALAIDPEFALAWVQVAKAYGTQAILDWAPAAEGVARARESVARALALEPDLAEGHAVMGAIQMHFDWDWHGAEASIQRALELAPGSGDALIAAGALASTLGRLDDAIALHRQVVEQDPLSASGYHKLGLLLDANDRLTEAEAAYRKALELGPQLPVSRACLALNLLAQGRGDEASAEAARETHEAVRLWALAIIEHSAGRRTESDAALRELTDSAYLVAAVYGARGDADLAFDWLERAYVQRDGGLGYTKTDRLFRSLHADPRWDAFLHKMGLAD
jgi:tetratricopeptide (TPR) repeat protein